MTFLKKKDSVNPKNSVLLQSLYILKVADGVVFRVVAPLSDFGTTDAMKILETEFGKDITTRS